MRTIFLVAIFACVAVAFAAPVQNPLGEDAEKLKKEAQDVIAKLKSEGKHVLAAEITVIEKEIEALEKKVKEINPTTEVGKIAQDAAKKVLAALETKLKAEIKKLGGSFFDTKQQLGDDAAKLKKEAQDVISKLKAEGKHVLAEEISIIEKEVELLETKIKSLNPSTEVGKIALHAAESVLKALETKLKAEIKKLSGAFFDTKQDLQKDADKLKKEAQDVISKLKAEGKHVLAAEISVIEKEVEELEKKVHNANPTTEVGKIALHAAESVLKALETKLKAEMKKLGGAFFDTKQDLQKDADKLKKEAQDVIAKLKSEGKHVLATEIAVIEKEVEELEKKVHNANPTTEVGKIALHAAESVLKGLETKLKAEIKKLGGAFFDTKQDLEKDADKLKKEAQDVISKLKAEGKHVLAEEISIIEKEVEVLEKKLKEINPTTEVGKIAQDAAKKVLAALETKLKAEIKKLGGAFFDTKQDLQKDADKLKKEAQDVISKLKAEGKHVLAAEISVIEKEVEELEKKVHNANPTTEVGKIALHAAESVLKGLETKLKAEIKKLGGAFFDTKQDLEKDAAKLRAEAKKEAEKLKAEGKHVLAAEITVIEKAVEKLEAEVAHANPHTEVGKVALEAAKSVLKSLETKLKEKIAKLNNGGH